MTSPAPGRPGEAPRLLVGTAHQTILEGTRGRVLFPSPEFTAWPPFQNLVDTLTVGGSTSEAHPHRGEEVANYVLSGRLFSRDPGGRRTEVPAGSVTTLATVEERFHDVAPAPGEEARWIALVLRLPSSLPGSTEEYAVGPAEPRAGPVPDLLWRRVVGPGAPVRSVMGAEISDLEFVGPAEGATPIGRRRRAAAYLIGGKVAVEGRELGPGQGFLASGYASLRIEGSEGARLLLATVPSPG